MTDVDASDDETDVAQEGGDLDDDFYAADDCPGIPRRTARRGVREIVERIAEAHGWAVEYVDAPDGVGLRGVDRP